MKYFCALLEAYIAVTRLMLTIEHASRVRKDNRRNHSIRLGWELSKGKIFTWFKCVITLMFKSFNYYLN